MSQPKNRPSITSIADAIVILGVQIALLSFND